MTTKAESLAWSDRMKRRVRLMSACVADQCRELNLVIGDIIVGREEYSKHDWNEAKLELLWLGKTHAVWNVWTRRASGLEWRFDGEATCWDLQSRIWSKVTCQPAKPKKGKEKP